jgi:hypothetical protein
MSGLVLAIACGEPGPSLSPELEAALADDRVLGYTEPSPGPLAYDSAERVFHFGAPRSGSGTPRTSMVAYSASVNGESGSLEIARADSGARMVLVPVHRTGRVARDGQGTRCTPGVPDSRAGPSHALRRGGGLARALPARRRSALLDRLAARCAHVPAFDRSHRDPPHERELRVEWEQRSERGDLGCLDGDDRPADGREKSRDGGLQRVRVRGGRLRAGALRGGLGRQDQHGRRDRILERHDFAPFGSKESRARRPSRASVRERRSDGHGRAVRGPLGAHQAGRHARALDRHDRAVHRTRTTRLGRDQPSSLPSTGD